MPPANENNNKEKADRIGQLSLCCWRRPIFPGRLHPSIFGTDELNFRVRNGNGWNLTVINTNMVQGFFILRRGESGFLSPEN